MDDSRTAPDARTMPAGRTARGTVTLHGSKSIAQRALILGALAEGTSALHGVPRNRDVETLLAALVALGVPMETGGTDETGGTTVRVSGTGGAFPPGARTVDAGENGTALRCLLAVAALRSDRTTVAGAAHRPVGPLVAALQELGAAIDTTDGGPPCTVRGPLRGGTVSVESAASSQFATALVLVAPWLEGGLAVGTPGLVSAPYLALTARLVERFGGRVVRTPDAVRVAGGGLLGTTLRVEPDASAAAFPLAAAAVTGGTVTVRGLGRTSIQGDVRFAEFLARMGCAVGGEDGSIRVRGGALTSLAVDCADTPDLVPPLAAVAACATGTSRLSGVGHLRHKESDRLAVLVGGLSALGIAARLEDDTLVIEGHGAVPPGPPVTIDPAGDHRMAMAFSILGLRRPGVRIADPDCVAKSDPEYWTRLESLLTEERLGDGEEALR